MEFRATFNREAEDVSKETDSNTLDTTIDEWRDELVEMEAGHPGMTLIELMEELGVKKTTMQDRLKKLIESGRCIRGRGKRIGPSGRTYLVSVYQLVHGTKAGEK